MKHAYLIIAHHDWEQLRKQIELLKSDNHDIYVHIDKKSKDFDISLFNDISQSSRVYFFSEYSIFWGGYSQVETELFLFEKAFTKHYDYYHLLSGNDLPLVSNEELDKFFKKNEGKEFILFDEGALQNNSEISRRTKYYHFLQDYRRRYKQPWKNAFFTFCERVLLASQIVLHINRTKNLDWTIKYGSNWVSITDKLVKVILENRDKIEKVFSCTNCADELFVQTIAYNFGFAERVYSPLTNQSANVRFIDWNRGSNGNPYTFTLADYDLLFPKDPSKQQNLFARKFSESKDNKIISAVFSHLKLNKYYHS